MRRHSKADNGRNCRRPQEDRGDGSIIVSHDLSRRRNDVPFRHFPRWISAAAIATFAAGSVGTSSFANEARAARNCEPDRLGLAARRLPSPYLSAAQELVHVRIGGQDFHIPRNYFRHPPIGCGVEERAMLLRVLLPDLRPYGEDTAKEFASQRGHGNLMNILFSRPQDRIPLPKLLAALLKPGTEAHPKIDTYGLHKGEYEPEDDLYFRKSDNEISAIFLCRTERPNRSASCQHHFMFDRHNVQVTYGRTHLPRWQSIQHSVERMIRTFIPREHDDSSAQ